ncbi:MAG: hypothetical protein ACK41E_12055, partial [Deinococcales bacterium]
MKLEIRLDRPDGVYLAGDTVTGVVTIHDSDGGRGKIQLVREWRAHGRGSGDFGDRIETTIAEAWGSGTSEIPFEVPMPDGPFTYRGTNTNLDWYVRAETGGLLKTKAETDFIFGAVPNMPSVNFGPAYNTPTLPQLGQLGSVVPPQIAIGCGGLLFMLFVGILLLIELPIFVVAIAALVLAGMIGFGVYSLIRNALAKQKLGDVKLGIEPLIVRANDKIQVRFSTICKAALELEKIEVKLVMNEFYATGSGTNRTTKVVPIYTLPVEVSGGRKLQAGEKLEFALELPVPDGAATTFRANDNAVYWQVVVTVPIRGW